MASVTVGLSIKVIPFSIFHQEYITIPNYTAYLKYNCVIKHNKTLISWDTELKNLMSFHTWEWFRSFPSVYQ